MLHLAVKAAVSEITDLGEFEAIAATYDVDRVKDRIRFGAFEKTIAEWQSSGKNLPVHWNHSGAAKDIIGAVDPATMREVQGKGLYVAGKLDLDDSEVAREAWRSMKNNAVALSFGYMVTKAGERRDGIQDLLEIDLFEITVTPGPANRETRFLSLKAAAELPTDAELRRRWAELKASLPRRRSVAELRRESDRHRLDIAMDGVSRHEPEPAKPTEPAVPSDAELRDQAKALGIPVPPPREGTRERFRDDMFNLLSSQ